MGGWLEEREGGERRVRKGRGKREREWRGGGRDNRDTERPTDGRAIFRNCFFSETLLSFWR